MLLIYSLTKIKEYMFVPLQIVCELENVYASGLAVARALPLYSAKSGNQSSNRQVRRNVFFQNNFLIHYLIFQLIDYIFFFDSNINIHVYSFWKKKKRRWCCLGTLASTHQTIYFFALFVIFKISNFFFNGVYKWLDFIDFIDTFCVSFFFFFLFVYFSSCCQVTVEFIVMEDDRIVPLSEEALECVKAGASGVRLTAKVVDSPCSEMDVNHFIEVTFLRAAFVRFFFSLFIFHLLWTVSFLFLVICLLKIIYIYV